jgi:hypothetical protein
MVKLPYIGRHFALTTQKRRVLRLKMGSSGKNGSAIFDNEMVPVGQQSSAVRW